MIGHKDVGLGGGELLAPLYLDRQQEDRTDQASPQVRRPIAPEMGVENTSYRGDHRDQDGEDKRHRQGETDLVNVV